MAHELDTITNGKYAGKRAMFSVGETPWHDETGATVIAEAPSLKAAMELAGAGFEVATEPVFTREPDGSFTAVPDGQAVLRTDRRKVFGLVGKAYTPIQNLEAFEVLEPLLDSGVAQLETGGTILEGRDVWMMVKFNIDDPVVREVYAEEIVPFGLVTNNHSGLRRALVKPTNVRVVCRNTLQASLSDRHANVAIAVVHRKNGRTRLIEAAEKLWGGIVERHRRIADDYLAMKARILTVEEFTNSVLDVMAPMPQAENFENPKRYRTACDQQLDKRNVVKEKWMFGAGHKGDHSAWEAFNGAVEVLDHDTELYPVRGSRIQSLIQGTLVGTKSRVLDELMALCR